MIVLNHIDKHLPGKHLGYGLQDTREYARWLKYSHGFIMNDVSFIMKRIPWILNVVKMSSDTISFIPQFAIEEGGSEETLIRWNIKEHQVTIYQNGIYICIQVTKDVFRF